MQNLYFKPVRALLILSLFVITFLIPSLSFAWYGGRHYGYSGHYGYSHYSYSRHHGYRKYGGRNYYPRKHYQRRHNSDYPSRRYQQYPKSYSFTIPTNIKVNSDNNGTLNSNSEHSGINSSAWHTLTQGQYRTALNIFAQEAQSNPNSGVPKAGYALATASSGNLERGIWAMRRAFRIDPNSLHYIQLNKNGYLLIDSLIGQYSSQKNGTEAGLSFMISALHYLKHDYTSAKKIISNAHQYGDENSSSTNLQRLINQQLTDQKN